MTRTISLTNCLVSLLILSILVALDGASVSALPQLVSVMKRDVWAPEITSPEAGDVWTVGDMVRVTWSTEDPPDQITNANGLIVLRTADGFVKGPGGLNEPLASNFSLFDGGVDIQVPAVPARTDYHIVLFGDSGNESPAFTISNIVLAALVELGPV